MYNEVPGWSFPESTAPSELPYAVREADSEQPAAFHQFDPAEEPLWESMASPESPWIRMPETENADTEDFADQDENR
ncbi:hypothetical protein JQC72_04200 [Polycladomyces sp. WAk]|uniref:Uncharacterized protein n=1 Tax=Polycladomyces zharkentensis TaxID=2807616 RepID=A0ABS2WGP7_9BACL|nr:hypothetical protein [Polycladomyces sp. WAk]MBN2908722.1 hypothetical protein [Polycladomyces sp. WAk]